MIKSKSEKPVSMIELDLTGPDGNAFYLLGLAKHLGKGMGKSQEAIKAIIDDMTASNYEHLLEVFETYFGDQVIMYK